LAVNTGYTNCRLFKRRLPTLSCFGEEATLCGERWNFQPLSSPALPWRWQVGWKQRLPGTALRRQNECLSGLQSTAGDDKVVGALTLELLQRILNE